MTKRSKRLKKVDRQVDVSRLYKIEEAVEVLQECPKPKFDESLEVSLKLGVDPKKSDQQVRSTVSLPHGTGKKIVLLVLAKGEKAKAAEAAGADYVGAEEFCEKIKQGWTDFNAIIATPEMMREVGKLGKVLGPRGLMPTPKAGTVTNDVEKAIQEVKAGKIEFKVDKGGVVNAAVGKISFQRGHLVENVTLFLQAVQRVKPSTAKGIYMKGLYLSTTMGPGLRIDVNSLGI